MGASTVFYPFDIANYLAQGVPALQRFLNQGELSPELSELVAARRRTYLTSEARHSDFYRVRSRPSERLDALCAGLQLDLAQDCTWLDETLGVRHMNLAELLTVQPARQGGCDNSNCAVRSRCPFYRHPILLDHPDAEIAMGLFQNLTTSFIRHDLPPLHAGRLGQFRDLQLWYGFELGLEDDQAEAAFLAARDELPLLLARLTKRGAIWGWADGGFGEGLLGWLDPNECWQMAEALDVYDVSAELPELFDPYDQAVVLPELRQLMAELSELAKGCLNLGLGILTVRD
ncbi:MAG: hypothetical protein CVV27_10215 [Candidatus Melainabacteria bacterium HGW-Melainabacteria-1]|nr:MAG: hypothetical protein CVV27_10215 [Candidatus Melainabacteria bacterium HGW-Melainabacteria-1]